MVSIRKSLERFFRPRARRGRVADAGLTLLEILIVTALIAGLAAVLYRGIFSGKKKVDIQTARTSVSNVTGKLKAYMAMNSNQCPQTLDDLVTSKDLDKKDLKDPWNRPYVMRCPGQNDDVEVVSFGPDGQEGTPDDIKSWEM